MLSLLEPAGDLGNASKARRPMGYNGSNSARSGRRKSRDTVRKSHGGFPSVSYRRGCSYSTLTTLPFH